MPESISLTAALDDYGNAGDLAPLTLWRCERDAAPVVLIVPALGTPAGVYRRLAESFVAAGAHVAVCELRGVAASPVRASRAVDWGYADLVDGEIAHAYAALRLALANAPIVALGHSLGGHVLLMHQARHPEQPLAGISLVASGAPYWRAYPWPMRWVTLGLGIVAAVSSVVFGHFPGHRLGFGGRQSARLMREWARIVRNGRFDVAAWTDGGWRRALAQLATPIQALAIPGDTYVTPQGIAHLLAAVGAKSEIEHVPMAGSPGHFGWLREPPPVVQRVLKFVKRVA